MDIGLRGDVDGPTVGRTIETTAGIPVIYLSGYTPAQLTAQNDGPASLFYLTKPTAEAVLARTLTRALDYAARQRTLQALRPQAAESRQQTVALQARAKELYQRAAELRQLTQRGPLKEDQEPPAPSLAEEAHCIALWPRGPTDHDAWQNG